MVPGRLLGSLFTSRICCSAQLFLYGFRVYLRTLALYNLFVRLEFERCFRECRCTVFLCLSFSIEFFFDFGSGNSASLIEFVCVKYLLFIFRDVSCLRC